jgi:hypothetical protein
MVEMPDAEMKGFYERISLISAISASKNPVIAKMKVSF